jgi:peptide-methionine (S)-S-oxide reductase
MFGTKKLTLPLPSEALPGRATAMPISNRHFVNGNPIAPPFPSGIQTALFGLGCFWGAERKFWQYPNIYSTAVGYSGGFTPNPTYDEVCTGKTGHNEVVLVLYNPEITPYLELLTVFWQVHNPTQGMGQGNDKGTQYRSGIYTFNQEQLDTALASKDTYQNKLTGAGFPRITTENMPSTEFYYAEDYHQQYLAKEPQGYCGLGGLGVAFA